MDFINKIIEIGNSNISDNQKVVKVLEYINSKYSFNSKPVQASKAKKILLENNLISNEEAINIKYPDITKELFEDADSRLTNQETIQISKDIYNKLVSFENSDKPEELIVFLLLVSGRRFNEVFNNNFKLDGDKLIIDKLSKRKPDNKKDFEIKLILIKSNQFIKLHNKFKKINKLDQNSLNRKVNRMLNKLNLTSHKMRSIYLYYHLSINKIGENKSTHMVVKNLLHHQKTESGKFYSNKFLVEGLKPDYTKMTNKKLKELLEKKNINSTNTKGFNKLKKSELINLLQ